MNANEELRARESETGGRLVKKNKWLNHINLMTER